MTPLVNTSPRIAWLVPGDKGGGVIWVADSCCRQSKLDGYEPVLLTMAELSAPTLARIDYRVDAMKEEAPYAKTPRNFVDWVSKNKPDIVFINNCDTMDDCAPYLPPQVRFVYVVHDTMSFYWKAAVKHEASFDAIVAVSEETGRRFRDKLKDPSKLHIIQNGTLFPTPAVPPGEVPSTDVMFVGGDDPRKGAWDVLTLWPKLQASGFSGRLHWFGRVSDDFANDVTKINADGRITLHGHVPRTEIFDQMGRSAVILMLSRAEACSIAVLEGMSMGCIPVAWNVEGTGTKEIVAPEFQFLSPLGDFGDLVRQVHAALSRRAELGPQIAADARDRFTEARMWAKYRVLCEQLLAAPPASRPLVGQTPPDYKMPVRASYLVPAGLWRVLRPRIARSAKLYYFLRNQL